MAPQFIYTMKGLGKVHPPDAVGPEGHLAVVSARREDRRARPERRGQELAAEDHGGRGHEFLGEAFPADGITVGFLPQEPRLDPSKDVKGNVEEGVAETKALLDRFDELNMKLGEDLSPEEMDKLLEEQGRLQDRIDAVNALGHRLASSSWRWTRCAVRRPMRTSRRCRAASAAAWRCAGCCSSRPICCCSTSRPTTSMPNRWRGSSSILQEYKGTVIAVTHDRYFLDNVAGWILELDRGYGIPWKGNYSSWLDQKQQRLALEEKSETQAPEDAAARARMDPHVAARAAGQGQGAPHRLRAAAQPRTRAQKIEQRRNLHSARPAPRRRRGRSARACARRMAIMLLMEDLNFTLPRGGIVGVIGPNGAGKTTLFRMIIGQEKPDAGTLTARRDRAAGLRRSEPRRARRRTRACGKKSPAARTS